MLAIVELHDVTPYYYDELCRCLELLSLVRIEKFSLLVIPNFREMYPLYKYPSFVKVLHHLHQEIVMHGYSHTSKFQLRHILYTYGEGEMGGINLYEVFHKIESGLEILEAVNLNADVFVPPAWIPNVYLEDILSVFGFVGVGYRRHIKNLENNCVIPSSVITFSSRKVLSYLSTKLIVPLYKLRKKHQVLRLALHMKDFKDKKKIALWRLLLNEIKKDRRLVSYGEILGKSGSSPAFESVQPAGRVV